MFHGAHRDEHKDDGMMLLQANLDDMNPEMTAYVSDLLFAQGANDVYWIPIIMKNGRPGVMLNVLTDQAVVETMEDIIFRETTTLGIRRLQASVHRLGRKMVPVETEWGTITVKAGVYRGDEVQYAPEYRECAAAARNHGVPLKRVYDEVRRLYAEIKESERKQQG